jgi:hypothetical protein
MTREDIIKMAREAKMPFYFRTGEIDNIEAVEKFARLVAEEEREACAKVCEDLIGTRAMARHCADEIRARGGEK